MALEKDCKVEQYPKSIEVLGTLQIDDLFFHHFFLEDEFCDSSGFMYCSVPISELASVIFVNT